MRGRVSGSFLLGALFLAFAFGSVPPDKAARLAALGAVALTAHPLLSAAAVRSTLGPFADAVHLTAGLLFLLAAMALTGGIGSELYPLLLVDVVVACELLGTAAGSFLALATVSGLLILAGLTGLGGTAPPPLGLAIRALAPAALLIAFELTSRRPAPARTGSGPTRSPAAEPQIPNGAAAAGPITPSETRSRPEGGERADGAAQLLHDLKSPLTVARLYADMLAEQAQRGEPPTTEHVENLRAELGMAESLLDPERAVAASGPAERTDVVKLLGELAGSYRAAHAGHLQFEFIAEQPRLPVLADALALRRAFRNVLDNAVKYTQPGGRVQILAGKEAGWAFVVISDTGVGMSAAERESAFEASFRGARARWMTAGRGLGLGITRELLKAHGGTIALASREGHGSDVTIRLPLAERDR
jgi:signal transduction histidine kinase